MNATEPRVYLSRSAADTEALGEQWGRAAQPGWIIGLTGDLGAGKTQLVKGLARGLDIAGRIHSPTFTLVHEHSGGRMALNHLDLYRLESPSQIAAAGLEDYFYQTQGVTVIEWVERWPILPSADLAGCKYRRVQIEIISETERRITYEDFGA